MDPSQRKRPFLKWHHNEGALNVLIGINENNQLWVFQRRALFPLKIDKDLIK